MNDEAKMEGQVCESCGARAQPNDKRCWLCSEDKTQPNPFGIIETEPTVSSPSISNPIDQTKETQQMLAIILIFSALLGLLIFISLNFVDFKYLAPYAVLFGPAILITAIRGFVSRSEQAHSTIIRLILTFVVSTIVTFAIVGLLVIALVVLLFISCLNGFH
jgi:hypothetical protein